MTTSRDAHHHGLVIVVPVYNRPDLVRRAVGSVIAQWVSGVRVVVVDDGSEPVLSDTFEHPEVHVVRTPHAGVAAARNAGVAAFEAPWVAFLDSDDELQPGWVAAVVQAIDRGASLWSCAATYRWADGSSEQVSTTPIWRSPDAPRALFLAGAFAVQRSLFVAAGGYREGLRHGENTDLGWRLGELLRTDGTVVTTDRSLLTVHANRSVPDPVVLLDSALMVLADAPALLRADRASLATYHAIAGVAASRCGRRREAVRLLAAAVRINPRDPRHFARLVRASLHHGST